MPEESPQIAQRTGPGALGRLLGSKSLWLAILVTAASAAWWAYSVATTSTQSPAATSLVAGEPATTARPPAPATLRYGASFIAAFLVAFAMKKVLRSVLLVSALLVGAIVALKYLGILDFDWDSAQKQVEHGVELAKTQTQKYGESIFKALPSGIAGGAGAIFGARRG